MAPNGAAVSPFAASGSQPDWGALPDADEDGLPDAWETGAIDTDGNGTTDLNLAAMGADPQHKDIFLEIDFMQNHALMQSAIDTVTQAFATAPIGNPDATNGITLHVDNGPASTMDPVTGQLWGVLSDQDQLAHDDVLGGFLVPSNDYDWTEFDALKSANFGSERRPAFHYVIAGHGYGNSANDSSGLSRGIGGSDLLVTLGVGCTPGDSTSADTTSRLGR